MCDTSNFRKAIDNFPSKRYNGIVNSKGAADMVSVALFLVYSANSIHKGVYEVRNGFMHPFEFFKLLSHYFFKEELLWTLRRYYSKRQKARTA